ncbi:MAG: hypothetical protein Q9160_005116 [Pyrenula sp. 1 TL-2023]
MEGSVGTLTSSYHPILGAIIRFLPRNCIQPQGLRVGNGNVNPQWMTRMWDVVIIAGRSYSQQERRYYKTYEGYDWITMSRDRTVAKVSRQKTYATPLSSTSSLRRRKNSALSYRSTQEHAQTSALARPPLTTSERERVSFTSEVDSNTRRNRYDGEWDFESDDSNSVSPSKDESTRGPPVRHNSPANPKHARNWYERLAKGFARSFATRSPKKPHANADSYNVDVEDGRMTMKVTGSLRETSLNGHNKLRDQEKYEQNPFQENGQSRYGIYRGGVNGFMGQQSGRRLLDGEGLQEYIAEKKNAASSSLRHGPLLLTWPTTEEEEADVSGKEHEPRAGDAPSNDWQGPYLEMKQERSQSYADRWRTTIRNRSRRRERRHSEAITKKPYRRRSSTISRTERDIELPQDNGSVSQRRKMSGGRNNSSPTPPHSEHRGRRRARSPRNSENHQITYSSRRDDASRERTRGSSIISQQEQDLFVTYGNSPVDGFEDADNAANERWDDGNDNGGAANWQRKPKVSVGFKLGGKGDDPYPSRSDTSGSIASQQGASKRSASNSSVPVHPTREPNDSFDELNSQRGEIIPSEDHKYPDNILEDRHPKRIVYVNVSGNNQKSSNAEVATSNITVNNTSPEESAGNADFRGEDMLKPDVPFKDIPDGAQWTKINLSLVDPAVLEAAGERFWVRPNYIVVLRLLGREEIQIYADRTQDYRHGGDRQSTDDRARLDQELESSDSDEGKLRPLSPIPRTSSPIGYHYKHPQDKRFLSPRRRKDMSPVQNRRSAANWLHDSGLSLDNDLRFSQSPSRMSEGSGSIYRSPSPRVRNGERDYHGDSESPQRSNRGLSGSQNDDDFFEANSFTPRRFSSRSSRAKGSDEDDLISVGSVTSNEIVRSGTRFPSRTETSYPESSLNFTSNDSTTTIDTPNQGQMDWLWICQADVIPGYFATPWHRHFSEPVCLGAISTMIELLRHFTTPSTLTFTQHYPHHSTWIRSGHSTHPSYAINAMGGIIVSGKYPRVHFPSLEARIPPIQLLRSYTYQVSSRSFDNTPSTASLTDHLSELMSLDTWLAFSGRLPPICDGRNNLLRRMPPLIQKLMDDFEPDFRDLDRTAMEGGLQVITEMAELVRQELGKEGLSEAEQLFTAVAVLRTAKMALAVVRGPRTEKLRDIFLEDAWVYLV